MKELLKCKPCGYIIRKEKLGDVCPACGVSSKVFEPYKDRVAPKRRFLLDLDLHPIAVHFPQTIAVFIMNCALVAMVFPNFKAHEISEFVKMLAILMPISVFGAFVSGIIDGKLRFKKIDTLAHRRKIVVGSIMILVSLLITYVAVTFSFADMNVKVSIFVISCVALALAISLALTGKKLLYCEMPG